MGYYRRPLWVYPITLGVIALIGVGVAGIKGCQYVNNEDWVNLDDKVKEDLGANYFTSESVSISVSGQNNYVKIIGSAEIGDSYYQYAEAKYQVSEANLTKIMPNLKTGTASEISNEMDNMSQEFLKTLLEVLNDSQFVDSKFIEELALNKPGNAVLNIGDPVINEENGTVGYIVNLLKTTGTTLKVGTLKIEAPLDEELIKNSKNIYLKDKHSCSVQVLDVQTFENVQHANLVRNHLILDDGVQTI